MLAIFPYIIAFMAMSGYATLTVIAKKIQADIPSFFFIAITMAVLSVLSLMIALLYEKDFNVGQLSGENWLWLLGFSLLNLVSFVLLLFAIKYIPVAEYQLILLMSPIVGGGISYLILQEAFKMQYLYGLVFIAVGLFIALRN